MALLDELDAVLAGEKDRHVINSIPYARFLGLVAAPGPDGTLQIEMPYDDSLIGSPYPPRLHGGTIGALMEFAGTVAITLAARDGDAGPLLAMPKTIGITIEYMRGGAPRDTFASAEVLRLGRRVANVRAKAWQDGPDRLNATATMHFLMPG